MAAALANRFALSDPEPWPNGDVAELFGLERVLKLADYRRSTHAWVVGDNLFSLI